MSCLRQLSNQKRLGLPYIWPHKAPSRKRLPSRDILQVHRTEIDVAKIGSSCTTISEKVLAYGFSVLPVLQSLSVHQEARKVFMSVGAVDPVPLVMFLASECVRNVLETFTGPLVRLESSLQVPSGVLHVVEPVETFVDACDASHQGRNVHLCAVVVAAFDLSLFTT